MRIKKYKNSGKIDITKPIGFTKPSIEQHKDNTYVITLLKPIDPQEMSEGKIYIDKNGTARIIPEKGYPSIVVGELPLNNVYPEFEILTGVKALTNLGNLIKPVAKKVYDLGIKVTSKATPYLNAISPGTKEFFALPQWKQNILAGLEAYGMNSSIVNFKKDPSISTGVNMSLSLLPYTHIVTKPINEVNKAIYNYNYFKNNPNLYLELLKRLNDYIKDMPLKFSYGDPDGIHFEYPENPFLNLKPKEFLGKNPLLWPRRLSGLLAYLKGLGIFVNPLTWAMPRHKIMGILGHEVNHYKLSLKKGIPLTVYSPKAKYYLTNPNHPLYEEVNNTLNDKNKNKIFINNYSWNTSPEEFDSELLNVKELLYLNSLESYKDFNLYAPQFLEKIVKFLSKRFNLSKENTIKLINLIELSRNIEYHSYPIEVKKEGGIINYLNLFKNASK